MSYPYTMRAAQRVLVAAQEWADADEHGTLEQWADAEAQLKHAVAEYRREAATEHVQGPDIDADERTTP